MSINNYLSSSAPDNDNGRDIFHDYRHASRLYVEDLQARAPKYGFLYYVNFVINRSATLSDINQNVGMFVRRIDLPRFSVKTETMNQYNRKTVVQTKLEYSPINMDFHDDNSDITNSLWINYYRNSFADSRYEENDTDVPTGFGDTKYGDIDYTYGVYDRGVARSFFKKIDGVELIKIEEASEKFMAKHKTENCFLSSIIEFIYTLLKQKQHTLYSWLFSFSASLHE
jgi:hypothetical protein